MSFRGVAVPPSPRGTAPSSNKSSSDGVVPSLPPLLPPPAPGQQPSSGGGTPRLPSSRAQYALVPKPGGSASSVDPQKPASSMALVTTGNNSSRRRAADGGSTTGDTQSADTMMTLTPRHLRDIGKFIESNLKLGHAHRSAKITSLIPSSPFVKRQTPGTHPDRPGDPLLQLSVAPVHPKESALDVPMRLTCPESYHCPAMVDPRSQSTIASRIVALLKGAASVPVHWDGEAGDGERDVAKINAIRDSETRATAANRAQQFSKEARAHAATAAMCYNSGALEKAIQVLSVAVQRFEIIGDAQGVAYCHNILGVCLYRRKEYKMALVHHRKQAALSAPYGQAVAQINMGVCYSALGELPYAEQAFSDALNSALEAQDPVLETIALGNLGLTFMRLGDVRKSQSNLEQCLEHCSVAGDRVGAAVCLLLLGEVYAVVEDTEHSIFYFEHAFRVAAEAGVSDLQEIARVSVGVARGTQNAKASLTAFAQKLGRDVGMADLLMSLPQ